MTNDAQTIQQEGRNGSLGSEAQSHGGKPEKGPLRLTEKEARTFWSKVWKGGPLKSDRLGACWEWIGGCTVQGYGVFGLRRKQAGAHRVSFAIHHHVLPAGFVIKHACSNRKCVNPNHLLPVAAKENAQDVAFQKREIILTAKLIARFNKCVSIATRQEHGCPAIGPCWNWEGPIRHNGYGLFQAGAKRLGAHRFAFEIANGRAPENDCCHKCDNRKCVNPEHLFDGTRSDNMRDCASKGRLGESNMPKEFCKRGHALDQACVYINKAGKKFRMCRACRRQRQQEFRLRRKS